MNIWHTVVGGEYLQHMIDARNGMVAVEANHAIERGDSLDLLGKCSECGGSGQVGDEWGCVPCQTSGGIHTAYGVIDQIYKVYDDDWTRSMNVPHFVIRDLRTFLISTHKPDGKGGVIPAPREREVGVIPGIHTGGLVLHVNAVQEYDLDEFQHPAMDIDRDHLIGAPS